MQFQEVISQEEIKRKIIHTVEQQKIAHAQLFSGMEGSGAFPLALAYAQYVLCTNRTKTDSCGVCASCIKVQMNIHPDLHYVYPIVKGKLQNPICENYLPEWRKILSEKLYFGLSDWYTQIEASNAQGTIYAAESNEIVRKMQLKPYESEYKIMFIWMPELMNETCANKILKLIEEPSEKSLFLLITENREKIITTILSRVQYINIPPLKSEEIATFLMKNNSIDLQQAQSFGRLSAGSIIAAQNLLETSEHETYFFERFTFLMRQAYLRNIIELKNWSEEMAGIGREKQKSFFIYAQRMIRENFILNFRMKEELNYMNHEESEFSIRFSPFIKESNVFPLMDELGKAQMHVEKNVNVKMIFFDLSLKSIMLLKT